MGGIRILLDDPTGKPPEHRGCPSVFGEGFEVLETTFSRLPTVLSTANSLTQGLSDIITVEIPDGSDASPSPQPSEKLDQVESAGIINQVKLPTPHQRMDYGR
jgi:hypothetical protein